MAWSSRLVHAFNAFVKDERLGPGRVDREPSYYDRGRSSPRTSVSERTTVASIYNRIAIDCASNPIRHVRLDNDDRFLEYIRSTLDLCLTTEANLDQSGRAMLQDGYHTMMEEGVVALAGIDMSADPEVTGAFEVGSIRVGVITEWKPSRVKVRCWNEKTGEFEEIWQGKRYTPIVQNPLRAVMNNPNSTLKRLIYKLSLLDLSDENVASGKLDIIIQMPYTVKSEARRQGANQRREDIEMQLKGSKYGVAWTDATEKITQLNRPAENNLLAQIEWLTQKVYSELGITKEVMDGTADEAAMVNYYNRTIEPFVSAFVDEIKRKFLTKTARTQGQSIMTFRDPFKWMTVKDMAEVGDKFTRNEILTSNEMRQGIGFKPHNDPAADQLRNSNMPVSDTGVGAPPAPPVEGVDPSIQEADAMSTEFDSEIERLSHGDRADAVIADALSHAYDPAKAHAYYLRVRKLKGRLKGKGEQPQGQGDSKPSTGRDGPTNKHRVTAVANKAAADLGPERTAAIQRLANKAKRQLEGLTNDFRDWVNKHPRATPVEKQKQKEEVLAKKNQVVKKLKADVAQITAAASTKSTPSAATEGRHH